MPRGKNMDVERNDNDLVHCVYSSAGTIEFSHDDIIELLEKARDNNAKLDITGMLLYDNGSFFQVLEGRHDTVTLLLKAIQQDDRHNHVVKIIYENIDNRDFSEWTMGYSDVTKDELRKIEGLNDFFRSNSSYIDLDKGRAKTLLKAFKDGQWRASIS